MIPTKRTYWRTVTRDGAAFLTIAVLMGVIFAHRSALQDRDDRLAATTDKLVRLQVVDRLIGVELPPIKLKGIDGGSVDFGEAVKGGGAWVLAPKECAGCLDAIGEWNFAGLLGEARADDYCHPETKRGCASESCACYACHSDKEICCAGQEEVVVVR